LKRLWITRASPGAEATAARVRTMGFEALVIPVMEVRLLPATIDLAGVGALAFTSVNGVRAFAAASRERGLRVFAVGTTTAGAARDAGFSDVLSADGDVDALAAVIATGRPTGAVLHAGAAEPAGDLTGDLARLGVEARAVALYETAPAKLPSDLAQRIGAMDGVIAHSPRAGRILAEIFQANPAPHLAVYCLSPEVAATLEGGGAGPVFAAPLPNEDALLSLLA
jgi:uroporphyrinogen-III synthase